MRGRSVLRVALGLVLLLLTAAPAAAQPATPAPSAGTPLADLMRLMPDSVSPGVSYAYADYEQQLAARGISGDAADMAQDEFSAAVSGLPQPRVGFRPDPAWREAFGFDLRDVDQFLDVNTGDRHIAIFRGSFDPAALHTAWETSEYTPVDFEGITYHSAGEDFLIDFEHPTHSLHVGQFSHLVTLNDWTVVATAHQAEMEEVIRVHAGERPALSEGLAAAVAAAAPADLAGARIVHGGVLQYQLDPLTLMPLNPNVSTESVEDLATQVAELEVEVPRMPPIAMALVGVTTGELQAESTGPPADAVAVLAPLSPIAAELVAEVAADRFIRLPIIGEEAWLGRPYAELFTGSTFETVAGGEAVVVRLTPAPDVSPVLLVALLNSRNLSLFYW